MWVEDGSSYGEVFEGFYYIIRNYERNVSSYVMFFYFFVEVSVDITCKVRAKNPTLHLQLL